ncbi:hypothetical protein WCU98_22725 [Pectobacterium parmentieri]|uniref:hypothetical protein n=1 Tax=Pectobacterium parmentieri TaxID=1905730 RepID=UPI00301889D7
MMKLKEALGVYWNSMIGDVNGQTFYSYSNDVNYFPPEFPSTIWHDVELKSQRITGDDWVVWLWDVKFNAHPHDWLDKTEKTLLYFIENLSVVSWCGLDGCFSEPPGLFDPNEMSEGIYAAIGSDKIFIFHTDFDDEYKNLEREDLIKLKEML